MKIRLPFYSLILALAIAPGVRAQDTKPKAAADKEETTELGDKMDNVSSAFKKLRKQVNDATKNEDSIKQVGIIRENMQAALKLEPARKADVPAADQAKFIADYQAKMKSTLEIVGKLEDALKAGDNAAAAKIFADLGNAQKEGHKEFKRPDKKKT